MERSFVTSMEIKQLIKKTKYEGYAKVISHNPSPFRFS